jgi:hypothetical protein
VWIQYSTGPVEGPDQEALALFTTLDGGKTWKPNSIFSLPTINHVDVVGPVLFAANSEPETIPEGTGKCPLRKTSVKLFSLGPDRPLKQTSTTISVAEGAVMHLSFINSDRGWATVLWRLFSTDDAGATWAEVTPGGPPRELPSVCIQR